MSEKKPEKITLLGGGAFYQLSLRIKLIMRLMADGRVHPLLKLLPLASLIYLLVPDLAPGPLDDAAIIWLGATLFVELCPPEVVAEHLLALQQVVPGEATGDVSLHRNPLDEEDIIDAEFWEK